MDLGTPVTLRVSLFDDGGTLVESSDHIVTPGCSDRGSDDYPDTATGETVGKIVADYASSMTADRLAWSITAEVHEETR